MSDLLSPIYSVMEDESEAFWCFVYFMDIMKSNFSRDQQGMHLQLMTLNKLVKVMMPDLYAHLVEIDSDNMFCAFRWILILFKREFSFEIILRIWEIFWTGYLTSHLHLFMALAILDIHKNVIINNLTRLDELLEYTNDLAMKMDYRNVLRRAEFLFRETQAKLLRFYLPSNGNGQEGNSNENDSRQKDMDSVLYLLDKPVRN